MWFTLHFDVFYFASSYCIIKFTYINVVAMCSEFA